jgi:15-cis-phytoene synthase
MTDDEIFRKGSRTYYAASRLFPPATRRDVARLYSFVRVADDFVDNIPQDLVSLDALAAALQGQMSGNSHIDMVAKNMALVSKKYHFDPEWTAAFLAAMRSDAQPQAYETIEELRGYIYGSAEVVGLMMAQILGLDASSQRAARMQGAAMQLINFVRDIAVDIELGRSYLPAAEYRAVGMTELTKEEAYRQPDAFVAFLRQQLGRYYEWQAEAESGMHFIPLRYRRALRVANDGYAWTAARIARDPFIVFDHAPKPSAVYLASRAAVRLVRS